MEEKASEAIGGGVLADYSVASFGSVPVPARSGRSACHLVVYRANWVGRQRDSLEVVAVGEHLGLPMGAVSGTIGGHEVQRFLPIVFLFAFGGRFRIRRLCGCSESWI